MEARFLYVTVHSASDLPNVRELGRMKVYAKVTVAENSKYTKVDRENEMNPKWNTTLDFFVPVKEIIQAGGKISAKIELFCQRTALPDKHVGESDITVQSNCTCTDTLTVPVKTCCSDESFGTLKYSCVLGDIHFVTEPPPSKEVILDVINSAIAESLAKAMLGN